MDAVTLSGHPLLVKMTWPLLFRCQRTDWKIGNSFLGRMVGHARRALEQKYDIGKGQFVEARRIDRLQAKPNIGIIDTRGFWLIGSEHRG